MIRLPAERARDSLLAAIEPVAAPFTAIATTSRDWACGLFYGARHRIAIRLDGTGQAERAARLMRILPEMELAIERGFVADVQVSRLDGDAPVLAIEALTIDEAAAGTRRHPATVSPAVRRVG